MRIGIDFGTYRASAAYLKLGVPALIEQPLSRLPSMPCTVYLEADGSLVAGQIAENLYRDEPGQGFRLPKRVLWEQSAETIGGRVVRPHDMVAAVFKVIRGTAQSVVGEAPDEALLTVPVSAPESFRRGVIAAAQDAGFRHVALISMPLAAAAYLAYRGTPPERDTVLVYVSGGGGFDAALLRCEHGVYRPIVAPVGAAHGGGFDFDRQIYHDLLRHCPAAAPLLAAERVDAVAVRARLTVLDLCRTLKERLSDVEAAGDLLVLPEIDPERYALTRERFNGLIEPYVAQSIAQCQAMIARAGIDVQQIQGVLLVGGSAHVPLVRSCVARELGRPFIDIDEPELVFARGAALYVEEDGVELLAARKRPAVAVGEPLAPHEAARTEPEPYAEHTAAEGWSQDHPVDAPAIETTAPVDMKAPDPIIMPDLRDQGMLTRLAAGHILSIHVVSGDRLLVVTAGGAELLNTSTGAAEWSIDHATAAGALSPDGQVLALAGLCDIVFWNLATRNVAARTQGMRPSAPEEQNTMSGVMGPAHGERQTPDVLKYVADQREDEERRTDDVTSVAFSPDGYLLAAGRRQHDLVLGACGLSLWRPADGMPDPRLHTSALQVTAVAFSADGRLLAAATIDAKAYIWEVTTGQQLYELRHALPVLCLAFSPDSTMLATGGMDKQASLWNTATGERQAALPGHAHPVSSLAFSPDGLILATGSRDRCICLWNTGDGHEIGMLDGPGQPPVALAFTLDGRHLAAAGEDDSVVLWEVLRRRARTLVRPSARVTYVAFEAAEIRRTSPVGTHRWPVTDGDETYVLLGRGDPFADESTSANGHFRAEGGTAGDHTVRLWEGSGQTPRRLVGHAAEVTCMAFNAASTIMASAGADAQVRLWALPDGLALGCFIGHAGPISALKFSPDGRYLASGGEDGGFRVWELASGKCMVHLEGHTAAVTLLTFSPDGRLLATGGGDRVVHLWSYREGWAPRRLEGHSEPPTSMAFSHDARLLATAGAGTVRVWRV